MSAYRLAYERAPAEFASSRYAYLNHEAAVRAAPTINGVRAARREAPYTHVAVIDGRSVRLVSITSEQVRLPAETETPFRQAERELNALQAEEAKARRP